MIEYSTIGIILGLSAGFAPGPLLTLVISETLQHDIRAGVKVALAPIITDLPILVVTLLLLAKLSGFPEILGIISLAGGFLILSMGYENIRSKRVELPVHMSLPRSLIKGILVNALSPHPYLFWLSVGAPIMTKAMNASRFAPFAFMGCFYALLVGSKILLAVFVGTSKTFLAGNGYIYTMRILGVVLCVLAFALFRDGLRLLGFL